MVHLCAGAVLGLLAFGLTAAIAIPVLDARNLATALSAGELLSVVGGGTAGTALFAALGVGIGTAVLRTRDVAG